MNKVFSSIGHFFGKVGLAIVSIVHKTATAADASIPEIEAVLTEGASIATLIPGIGPEVASLLNAGIQLLGDVKASIDGTDSVLATAKQQMLALAPQGYSVVLIKADVETDIATLLSTYSAAAADATTAVEAVHPPASPTVPSPTSVALSEKTAT